jgi:protein ImuB
MQKRYISIWFRHLLTDWLTLRRPELKNVPFVFAVPDHGRKLITAVNVLAEAEDIQPGMVVADANAIVTGLQVIDEIPGQATKLLNALGEWCIRYTPITAITQPDGLILDITGCTHIKGGERPYLKEIVTRLRSKGYDVRAAMADTIGAAWAIARFGIVSPIIEPGAQVNAMLPLPPLALRLDTQVIERMQKLGLRTIGSLVNMQRSALRRRFGQELLLRIDQAFGREEEFIDPIQPIEPYQERLPCLEPICTATGIEIALKRLLEVLCLRLKEEGKGIRAAVFTGYRMDGKVEQLTIGTNRASYYIHHLFKLFELKIATIEPALGIELFTLHATKVEDVAHLQEALWGGGDSLDDESLSELLDRLEGKLGKGIINRYLPQQHYWPERSVKSTAKLHDKPSIAWRTDRPRPVRLLPVPEHVEVSAPVPDYPPMMFMYKGKRHEIRKADGPERIEREWWLDTGEHRDYYYVEDKEGRRYWLFRAGHYSGETSGQWFIHGFFA